MYCVTVVAIVVCCVVVVGSAHAAPVDAGDDVTGGQSLWEYCRSNKNVLEFSTLVMASQVDRYFGPESDLDHAAQSLRALGVTRVFLETIRSGHRAARENLERGRDFLKAQGFEVGAAITTTWGEGFGEHASDSRTWICYSKEKSQRDLAEITAFSASLFDEVMFDDFLATSCTCDVCRDLKGDRTWWQYRTELMRDVSKNFIIPSAKKANPNVDLIIKYPQWYDKFHEFGYNVTDETALFDHIWIGTETRTPTTRRFGFVEPYESIVVYRWLSDVGGTKTRGAWFDTGDCDPGHYVIQAYQSVLAGAREVLFFNFGSAIVEPGAEKFRTPLGAAIPRLFELASAMKGLPPQGIYAYKPPHSSGGNEEYIYDFIGMLGLPLLPVAHFPEDGPVLLTTQAATDPEIAIKVARLLDGGGTAVATPAFLLAVRESAPELVARFGTGPSERATKPLVANKFEFQGETASCDRKIEIGAAWKEDKADLLIRAGLDDNRRVPFLTRMVGPNGEQAFVLNVRTRQFRNDLLVDTPIEFVYMPEPVVNELRRPFWEPLGLKVESPSRVGLYPFSRRLLVIGNYNLSPVSVTLSFLDGTPGKVRSLWGGEALPVEKDNTLTIEVPPMDYRGVAYSTD